MDFNRAEGDRVLLDVGTTYSVAQQGSDTVVTIDGGEWLKGAGQFNMLEAVEPAMWDTIERMVRNVKS